MYKIGRNAINASQTKISTKLKNKVLNTYINLIKKKKNSIINQNNKDVKQAIKKRLKNCADKLTGG